MKNVGTTHIGTHTISMLVSGTHAEEGKGTAV